MKITIIDNETKNINKLKKILLPHEITIFKYNEEYNINNCDLIILSGGSHHSIFYPENPYKKELQLIQNTDIPIIGICLGCQMIAKAYESSFGKLSNKIRKTIQITNTQTKETKIVFESHRYYIKDLGISLYGIYKSKFGREMIKHKEKNIRGLQFHPEITIPKNDGKILLEIIIEKLNIIKN